MSMTHEQFDASQANVLAGGDGYEASWCAAIKSCQQCQPDVLMPSATLMTDGASGWCRARGTPKTQTQHAAPNSTCCAAGVLHELASTQLCARAGWATR